MTTLENLTEENSLRIIRWFGESVMLDEDGAPRVVFHQTTAQKAEAIRRLGFDTGRIHARSTDEHMPDGIFFKPTDVPIGGLGTGADPVQMPFCLSLANLLRVGGREEMERFLVRDAVYTELLAPIKKLDRAYEKAYAEVEEKFDAYWPPREGSGPVAPEYFMEARALSDRFDGQRAVLAARARARASAYLAENGYDGLIVERDVGMFGRTVTTTMAFRPDQVMNARDVLTAFSFATDQALCSDDQSVFGLR